MIVLTLKKLLKRKKKSVVVAEPIQGYIPDGKVDNEDGFEILQNLSHKTKSKNDTKQTQYLVKCKGDWEESWVSVITRRGAPELMQEYQKKAADGIVSADILENVLLKVFNGRLEFVTNADNQVPENNEFKDLFDPKTQVRIPDPVGKKQLETYPYRGHFILASLNEKMENLGWKTYVEVPISKVPKDAKILRSVVVYCTKYNDREEIEIFEVRVCLQLVGSRLNIDESETYENIASFSIIRMLLCMAIRYDCVIAVTDVKNFFLEAKLPEDKVYCAGKIMLLVHVLSKSRLLGMV